MVLGVVAQSGVNTEKGVETPTPENMSMKEAVTNLVNLIGAIEGSLSGKANYEVVVDPIAVYVTL